MVLCFVNFGYMCITCEHTTNDVDDVGREAKNRELLGQSLAAQPNIMKAIKIFAPEQNCYTNFQVEISKMGGQSTFLLCYHSIEQSGTMRNRRKCVRIGACWKSSCFAISSVLKISITHDCHVVVALFECKSRENCNYGECMLVRESMCMRECCWESKRENYVHTQPKCSASIY